MLNGGFGEKIASYYGPYKDSVVLNFGLRKEFLDYYNLDEVLKRNRLVPELIFEDIENILG